MANLGGLLIAAGTAATNPSPNTIILPTTVVAATDIFTSSVAHGYTTGVLVRMEAAAGGTLPTGVSAGTDYYVRYLTDTTFTLHTSEAGAIADTGKVNATNTGTATFGIAPVRMYPLEPTARQASGVPSTAWAGLTAAGTYSPAMLPRNAYHKGINTPILLNFIPSAGEAVTYTVTVWTYNDTHARRTQATHPWSTPIVAGTYDLTGNQLVEIANEGSLLWYVQLSDISSGTVAVYFNNGTAEAF
jgi:hypothetical protein